MSAEEKMKNGRYYVHAFFWSKNKRVPYLHIYFFFFGLLVALDYRRIHGIHILHIIHNIYHIAKCEVDMNSA